MRSSSIEGQVLGDYRLGRRLGAGGIGAVYQATHVRTGRAYAIKVLLPEAADEPTAAARFRREAQALASVGHQGIVALHDFDVTSDGVAYLVMDQLEGEDLDGRLQRGPLSVRGAAQVFDEVAAALGAAHDAGVLHRDLKPSNVFLARRPGSAEHAVLLDFGLAKLTEGEHAKLTATGAAMGTPMYMSPEQAQGLKVDARTDVYALAAVLFEMLTGHAPFEGPSITAILSKVLTQPPPRLRQFDPELPEALEAVIVRALAKDPAMRPASVDALVDEVHAALGDEIPSAPRRTRRTPPPITRTTPLAIDAPGRPPEHRRRWVGGLALVAAAAVGGLVWWSTERADDAAFQVAPVPVGGHSLTSNDASGGASDGGEDGRPGDEASASDAQEGAPDEADEVTPMAVGAIEGARSHGSPDPRQPSTSPSESPPSESPPSESPPSESPPSESPPSAARPSAARPSAGRRGPRTDAVSLDGFDPRSLSAQIPRARAALAGFGQGLAEPRPALCAIPSDTSPLRVLPHGPEVVSRLERTRAALCADNPATADARAAHRASVDAARVWLDQLASAARR